MVLGSNELENDSAKLKNMKTGETVDITLGSSFVDCFSNELINLMFATEELL